MTSLYGEKQVPYNRFTLNRDSNQAIGLVAWWPAKLDGVELLRDMTSLGSDGVNNGATVINDAELGQVRNYVKASSQYYEQDKQLISGYPFTLCGWIRHTSGTPATNSTILGFADISATNRMFSIGVEDSPEGVAFLRARNTSSEYIRSTARIDDGLVHHLVGVFTSATSRELYLDGVSVGTDTTSVTYSALIDRWSIGRIGDNSPGDYFDGNIGDVRVYNIPLSAVEAYQLYDSQTKWELDKSITPKPWFAISIGGLTLLRIEDETVNVDDTDGLRFRSLIRLIANTINLSENILRLRSLIRLIANTVNISENILRLRVLLRLIADTINITEGIVRLTSLISILVETITISENILRFRALIRVLADIINISENILRFKSLIHISAETINVSEGILKFRPLIRTLSESINLSENILRFRALIRLIADTTNITESILHRKAITQLLADTINISETILRLRGLLKVLGETLNLNEVLVRLTGLIRILAETINLTESLLNPRNLIRIVLETLRINEALLRIRVLIRLLSDSINVSESLIRLLNLIRLIPETVNLSEGILRFIGLIRLRNETVNLTETRLRFRGLVKIVANFINFNEANFNIRGLIRIVSDTLQIVERVIIAGIVKIISFRKGIKILLNKRGVRLD